MGLGRGMVRVGMRGKGGTGQGWESRNRAELAELGGARLVQLHATKSVFRTLYTALSSPKKKCACCVSKLQFCRCYPRVEQVSGVNELTPSLIAKRWRS